jgi:hypothetical protein
VFFNSGMSNVALLCYVGAVDVFTPIGAVGF